MCFFSSYCIVNNGTIAPVTHQTRQWDTEKELRRKEKNSKIGLNWYEWTFIVYLLTVLTPRVDESL